MAFIDKPTEGYIYQPGWFLAHEECARITKNFKSDGDTGSYTVKNGPNGGKYVPMGSVYKDGGETAIGLVYEDVDVSRGAAAGSVVTAGTVYKDRLPSDAQGEVETITTITAIEAAPKVTRPPDKEA